MAAQDRTASRSGTQNRKVLAATQGCAEATHLYRVGGQTSISRPTQRGAEQPKRRTGAAFSAGPRLAAPSRRRPGLRGTRHKDQALRERVICNGRATAPEYRPIHRRSVEVQRSGGGTIVTRTSTTLGHLPLKAFGGCRNQAGHSQDSSASGCGYGRGVTGCRSTRAGRRWRHCPAWSLPVRSSGVATHALVRVRRPRTSDTKQWRVTRPTSAPKSGPAK